MDLFSTAATSVVTTLATLGVTEVVKLSQRRANDRSYPMTLARGPGDEFMLRNESRRPIHALIMHAYGPGDLYSSPTGHQGVSLLPKREAYLGHIPAGALVIVSWTDLRHGREVQRYLEAIRIKEDKDRYTPKQQAEQPLEWGG